MTDIVIPQVGEAVAEVTLVRWFKQEGDSVRKGEPLFEVDTDKYVVEIEAFTDGMVAEILVPEGAQVMPLQVVARLADSANAAATPTPQDAAGSTVSRSSAASSEPSAPHATGSPETKRQRVLASPKARRIADELDVDISSLTGTGRGGLVTAEDVEAAAEAAAPAAEPLAGDEQPLSRARRTVARRMQTSKQTIPHFYLMVDVDMSEAKRLRQHCVEELGLERAPSFTDIIVAACGRALAELPEVNVSYGDDTLRVHQTVNVGLAVAVKDGLVVPVLRDADRLDLRELSARTGELADRARDGRLHDSDLGEKSLVVSNLGMHGVDAFLAIIDMPDSMILSAGRVTDRCVPVEGSPSVRPMCTLGLSADHRALDGVAGARFLEVVTRQLESAFGLLEAQGGG